MIYYATDGTAVKIGYSVTGQVKLRITKLQTGNPRKITILAVCPGGRRAERALHRKFAHSSLRGEWFKRTIEIMTFCRTMRTMYGVE